MYGEEQPWQIEREEPSMAVDEIDIHTYIGIHYFIPTIRLLGLLNGI